MPEPKLVAQDRVKIYEGLSVKTVQQNGSDGQKLMASVFDKDKNGFYNKEEASLFESYRFKTTKDEIYMYQRNSENPNINIRIKYNNPNELNYLQIEEDGMSWNNKKGQRISLENAEGDYNDVDIDIPKNQAKVSTAKNMSGNVEKLSANNIDLIVSGDIENIIYDNGKLELKNVRGGLSNFWGRSNTKLILGSHTSLHPGKYNYFEIDER